MSPSSRARWAMLSQVLSGAASRARSAETSWSKRSSDRCDMCLPFYRVWFISKVGEQLSQLRARLEQLRFRSTRSDSELRSDLAVRVAFDVMEHEHRARAGRQPYHRLFYRFRDEGAIGVRLDHGGVVLDIDLELRDAADPSQGIERTVNGNAMCPCSELRVAAVSRQRSEDLHPYFLRYV